MSQRSSVLGNASWIIFSKIVQSILGLIITMLAARYLGPSNYGVINYAASIVAFITPIALLGFDAILVHEIVLKRYREGEIIGSAIGMSFIGSIFCIFGEVSFNFIVSGNETETVVVCFLYGIILIFQAFGLIQYWFQAQSLSKYSSITMLGAYVITSLYKVILLVVKSNIYWFALSNVLDAAIIAIILIIIYRKITKEKLFFRFSVAKELVGKSKYYILANLMITVCAQIDKIMLKVFIGDTATGLYSAAVACATMTGFVFSALIDSARPVIFETKKASREKYELNIKCLYSTIIYVSFVQCVLMTLFSGVIIKIIYGTDYIEAASALGLVVWYTTFAYIGSVRGIWLLAEGKQKYVTLVSSFSAIGNVLFNAILIPIMGMKGAALASLISQIFANILIPLYIKDLRHSNLLLINSLNPYYVIYIIKKLYHTIVRKI